MDHLGEELPGQRSSKGRVPGREHARKVPDDQEIRGAGVEG